MKKVLAFAGSNSPNSINQQLVSYASSLLNEVPSQLINLRDYPLELYGVEAEKEGIPEHAKELHQLIEEHDAFIISVSENNHSVSAAFKNTIDWLSRVGSTFDIFQNKPILLLSTSPGQGGASTALKHAQDILALVNGNVVLSRSVSSYYEKFEATQEGYNVNDKQLKIEIEELLSEFEKVLQEERRALSA